MKHYLKMMIKEQQWLEYRRSQSAKIARRYKYGLVAVLLIGFVLQSLVCLVGEAFGHMHGKAWLVFMSSSAIVFAVIYVRRFGIIRSISLYMCANVAVMVVTYRQNWNQVADLGFLAELATSFLGLIVAYFIGLKHFIEDSDW